MKTQQEKAERLKALHSGPNTPNKTFVIPNPWDRGSALLLEGMGFQALATSSAGAAFTEGKRDGEMRRDAMMEHIRQIASVTDLPVSADLGGGFGDGGKQVAEAIRLAAEAGAVGGSIEDATGKDEMPIYPPPGAISRIQAAVEAARSLPFPFTLTARCENFLCGNPDLSDTIKRLQAYQEAGADVLYAPGITTHEQIAAIISSVDRPVNVLVGLRGMTLTLRQAEELGVRRLSVGSGLAKAAYGAFRQASQRILEDGVFDFGETAGLSDLCELFPRKNG